MIRVPAAAERNTNTAAERTNKHKAVASAAAFSFIERNFL